MKRVGVVAPNTLVGRELRERLASHPELFGDVRLLSVDEEEIGQLAESGGGAAFVARLDDDALESLELVFFCGTIEADRPWLERLPDGVTAIVASLGARAEDGAPALAGIGAGSAAGPTLLVPHPAAVGTALLLARFVPFGILAAHAVALLPVSRGGEPAIEALFDETRDLLNFKVRSGAAARLQTAFNLAPAADDAADVARQALQALGVELALSVQVLAAGVFHGVGLSLHLELASPANERELRRALSADPRIELARKPATVSPASLAGNDRLLVGDLRAGPTPNRWHLWAAYDNVVRGSALTASELAEELLAGATRAS